MLFDNSNEIFQTAASFINQTSKHIFLTGKAGTGKTTFLKYIKEHSFKKMAVVAPTGVAAINAGGVTIHSFFQIPPGTYLPTPYKQFESFDGKISTPHTLFKNMRMNANKRDLLRELDLLVIDEVSMVRADLLDAMDAVLRHFRRQPLLPFGGVQVLYIGDLFQLPPVVANNEWSLLKEFYRSPFFFDALVMQQTQPVYIELKKIYRQTDDRFIGLLNNVRNNCCSKSDLDELHQYYNPAFIPSGDDHFITLTTHNDKADIINYTALKKLPGEVSRFKAEIDREFPERSYPADELLQLKPGAQVMFIKNDSGENRKYFNGKIGTIHSITEKGIQVEFSNEPGVLELKKETWQNIRYQYKKEKDEIEEEELGSFSQYPIRLAWAITIHKSQGLTFDKAIIDAGDSFTAGQVYVALSRLTSLEGLVLKSKIHAQSIQTNENVLSFGKGEQTAEVLRETLQVEQQVFVKQTILQAFNWRKLMDVFLQHLESYEERLLPDLDSCMDWGSGMIKHIEVLQQTGNKFQKQLEQILEGSENHDYNQLHERAKAACGYFIKQTEEVLLVSLNDHIARVSKQKRVKGYLSELNELKRQVERRKQQFNNIMQITKALQESAGSAEILQAVELFHKPIEIKIEEEQALPKKKKEKGDSHRTSLQLFRQGKTVGEIASERGLAQSTIEGHLASFVLTGEVDVLEIVNEKKLKTILDVFEKDRTLSSTAVKQELGQEYSYGEIRAAMLWQQREEEMEIKNLPAGRHGKE